MSDRSAELAPGARTLRILVVDDSAMTRTLIKRVACLCGIANVYEARNGLEAMQVLETSAVDCLLTDINMPGMSGIELLREVAKNERWRDLTRVVVSTDGSAARRDEARDLQVRFYVEKPFRPEVMRDVLTEITAIAGLR